MTLTCRLCAVLGAAFLFAGLSTLEVQAQDLHPSRRLSPLGMARAFVGDTYVKVTYGRPYQRGRTNIFGSTDEAMHQYGNVWRFGANEPTELTVSGPVLIGGTRVEAGTYSLFATPGASEWTIHVNDFRGGGAGGYNPDNDLAVIAVTPAATGEPVDPFTISLEESGEDLHLVAAWMDWELRVPISAVP